MELPSNLRVALDRALAPVPASHLVAATRELSHRYRSAEGAPPTMRSDDDALAYAAYRLPATFAAVGAALRQVRAAMPDWRPRSLLDVGAGPGTAAWAGTGIWPSLRDIELIERDERMIALGKALMVESGDEALASPLWSVGDIAQSGTPRPRDLITVSYALGEIDLPARRDVLHRLWESTSGVLLLVEPGTPRGFEHLRAARELLIEAGGRVAAPCPHSSDCPMSGGNWCHFSGRLSRSPAHQKAKAVSMGYEDEKYSYVAVTRLPLALPQSRILRHPQVRGGHIRLDLCTTEGLRQPVVSKRTREQFRRARGAAWGDVWPSDEPEPEVAAGAESRDNIT